MKNYYEIGWDNGDWFNVEGGVYGFQNAKAYAKEIAEENCGLMPEIRKVIPGDEYHEF